ncbi:MAG: leucine-rich repeat protein [Oscillospiraceae bacterium]|nr:leucine-rich repeat protein [Oscillospiraceae bacterium]
MKRIISLMLTMIVVIVSVASTGIGASAADSYVLSYKLNSEGTGYIVTSCRPVTGVLNDVKIPEKYNGKNVIGIEDGFHWVDWIRSIYIPSTVKSINSCAFESCWSLQKITVDSKNNYFCDSNGVLYNKNKTKLIAFPCRHAASSYTIPDTVTEISEYAFASSHLENVKISKNVTSISDYAFSTANIRSITLPNKLTEIGDYAFYMCSFLTTIKLPINVKSIGDYAFFACPFKKITIPKSMIRIGRNSLGFKVGSSGPDDVDKIPDFIIYGVPGSAAQEYANSNGISFVKVDIPAKPNLTKIENESNGIKVTWSKASGAQSYSVYRKTYSNSKWSGWSTIKTSVTSTSYTDTTAKSGVYYTYTVRAKNDVGLSSYNATGLKYKFISTPKLTSISNGSGKVTVKWNKVTGASGYYVYRQTYSNGKWAGWKKVATTSNNYYNDTKISSGNYYKYTVRAYNGSYASYYNTTGLKTKYLAVAPLKSAVSQSAGVKVTWGKVTGAKGYNIYRQTYSNGKWSGWSKVATVKSGSTVTYTDKSAKKGVTYKYTVRATSDSYIGYYNTKGLQVKDKY